MPARRLVNHIYHVCTDGMKEKDRRTFDREIEQKLPTWKPPRRAGNAPSWWKGDKEASMEAQDVMRFLSSMRS